MKCTIPGANVKVLARAIHALARIGDELYVEPEVDKISFRSVNSSRSAYSSFTFGKQFFAYYRSDTLEGNRISQEEDLKCKISMKSCLPVFRSPNTLDRQVEMCLLRLEADGSQLVVEMRCKHGVIKTHYMPIIECETLQVVYTKDSSANRIAAHFRVFSDAICNFQAAQEEISLAVTQHKTYLRSYTDDSLDPSKVISTEMCMEPGEFELYVIANDATITFCLKEFRALLQFAEATSLPIEVNFETSGRPVVFTVDNEPAFEVNFVLATLSPELESHPSTPQTSAVQERVSTPLGVPNGVNSAAKNSKKKLAKQPSRRRKQLSGEAHSGAGPVVNEAGPSTSTNRNHSHSSEQMFQNASLLFNSASLRLRESDEEDNSVPGTPPPQPKKRARFLFKRCFEPTFNPGLIPGHDIVLADDSAGED